MESLQGAMKDFASKMEEVMKDPASMAPGGGMAACADWYGSSVAGKLAVLGEDTKNIQETVVKLASDVSGPMSKLAEVLGSAVKELEGSLKRLSKLPAEVMKLGDTCDSPDDVAKIDTAPMKTCTDTSPIEGVLSKIAGLKDVLGPAVAAVQAAVQALDAFVSNAPDMIRKAFDVPTPLCFLTSVLLSQAPPAMKSLMEMVDKLKGVDLQPMVGMLSDASETIANLDIEKVKAPVAKFGSFAKEKVDGLDKVVKGAKAAGSLGGAASAMKGLGGKLPF